MSDTNTVSRRVEDWRAGLGRSSCSLLARPFVCECHSISTMLTFPIPATSNVAHCSLALFWREICGVPSELAEGAKGVSLGNLAIPEGRLASLVFLGRERPLECATRPC